MSASGNLPEKPFKGSFNIRITSDLHQKAALLAMDERTSLNKVMAEAVSAWINSNDYESSKASKINRPE